jgi:DNA-directed RNA polymerase specialized sigma24 family protein
MGFVCRFLRSSNDYLKEEQEGKMFGARKVRNQEPALYATRSEFCRIFEKDMNRLFLLSFLLTGNRTVAEQCFVGGLHIAQEGNLVFKEWAESWARRAIILNAIRMIRPRPVPDGTLPSTESGTVSEFAEQAEIARIVDLPAFERFAFVMSVLERYSDQECSLLLSCTRGDVAEARTRALDRMGKSADLRRKLVSISSNQKTRRDNSELAPELRAVPSLAASA